MNINLSGLKQELIIELFKNISDKFFNSIIEEDYIKVDNEIIMRILNRFKEDKTSILPYQYEDKIFWLILNKNKGQLIKHKEEIIDIVVDDYAESDFPNFREFNPEKKIGNIGEKLFPEGYAYFKSPIDDILFEKILSALDIWMELDSKRPKIIKRFSKDNAYYLRSGFHQSIALKNWEDANYFHSRLQENRFIDDYNLKFLLVKLLSAQDKWKDIWEDDTYSHMSNFEPLPKKVRKSLLTSFYKVKIMPVEEQGNNIDEISSIYHENKEKLGMLIKYRAGLSGEVILRVFTYKYYLDGDLDKLQELKNETMNDNTINLINNLTKRITEPLESEDITEENDKIEYAKKAIEEKKYDDAYLYALDIKDTFVKVKFLLTIAVMTEDAEIIKFTEQEYFSLKDKQKNELLANPNTRPKVKLVIADEEEINGKKETVSKINNWLDWFKAIIDYKNNEVISEALDDLISKDNYQNWNRNYIKEVEEVIMGINIKDDIENKKISLLNQGFSNFASYVYQDPEFPNTYAEELYENLLWGLNDFCNKNENNTEMIYKFSEGLLEIDIEKKEVIWSYIEKWFSFQPIKSLSKILFDTLELYFEYGLAKQSLAKLWNEWVGSLIDSILNLRKIELEFWLELGVNINGDSYLINHLKKIIKNKDKDEINYLKKLDETLITIFTLREKAAKRAAQKIKEINHNIEVRICTESKLTDKAKAYAKNSDINIITTDCISHALTYGIAPYLEDNYPIYPRSSGQSAIIEALEKHIKENY